MTNAQALDIMREGLLIAVRISAPILVLSMALGVLISILQAATQIHEQTITFVPKLLIIIVILIVGGSWMLNTLQDYFVRLLNLML